MANKRGTHTVQISKGAKEALEYFISETQLEKKEVVETLLNWAKSNKDVVMLSAFKRVSVDNVANVATLLFGKIIATSPTAKPAANLPGVMYPETDESAGVVEPGTSGGKQGRPAVPGNTALGPRHHGKAS